MRTHLFYRFGFVLVAFISIGALSAGCDSGSDGENLTTVRRAMLTNLADRVIAPSHDAFVSDVETLVTAITSFESDPSSANLDAVQTAWTTAARSWRPLSALNLPGPVRSGLYHNRISTWPVRIARVEEILATEQDYDEAYMRTLGSNTRGLPVLEYLFFDEAGNSVVLNRLSADAQANKRRTYARAAVQDLNSQAMNLRDAWSRTGGDALGTFEAADTEGRNLQSSVSRLVNEMSMVAEDIRHVKLGPPLGISRDPNKPNGAAEPLLVEAPYARISIDLIREDLAGLRALVTGNDGTGLAAYLDALDAESDGQPFSGTLLARIDAMDAATAALTPSLRDAVVNDAEASRQVYDESLELLRAIKTDLANWLGVSITFSDNDGDS